MFLIWVVIRVLGIRGSLLIGGWALGAEGHYNVGWRGDFGLLFFSLFRCKETRFVKKNLIIWSKRNILASN